MTDFQKLCDHARAVGLSVSALAALTYQDGFEDDFKSIALLSPNPQSFWTAFTNAAEAKDGRPDPIDRWSKRVVTGVARDTGGLAVFPFDGPPYLPFSTWAQRAGVAWQSPSGLLLHNVYGLWISFRGAVALRLRKDQDIALPSPCDACCRPCLSACPVGALSPDGFDHIGCLAHVKSLGGEDCAEYGCRVRRACPFGQDMVAPDAQIGTHMKSFTRNAST